MRGTPCKTQVFEHLNFVILLVSVLHVLLENLTYPRCLGNPAGEEEQNSVA